MFDGMPEQFYQFLAAAATTSRATPPTKIISNTTASLSLPLSFSLHHHQNHAVAAAAFPTYSPQPQPPPPPPPQLSFDAPYHPLLHHHHHPHSQFVTRNNEVVKVVENTTLTHSPLSTQLPTSLQDSGESQRSSSVMMLPEIPWSNDEMLALFRIRSSMDNTWFPDFIWENVSRKLSEIGFKRSAEKCKEKFEEETRSFNSSIISTNNNCSNKNTTPSNNNNYRLFGELEQLCNNNNNINNINDDDNVDHGGGGGGGGGDDHCPQTSLSQGTLCPDEDDNEGENEDWNEGEEDMIQGDRVGNDEVGEDYTRNDKDDYKDNVEGDEQSVDDSEKTEENTKRVMRKRKRQKKFEMFKGFCEKIVSKMMTQQEELHLKILEDMVKRDEEKVAKEEAWKKQEFVRLEKELEDRAHEQAVSGDRQAKILDFLNKVGTSSNILDSKSIKEVFEKLNKVPNITLSNSSVLTQDSIISAQLQPTSSCTTHHDHNHTHLVTNIPSSSSTENIALLSCIKFDNSKLPMSSSSLDQPSQNPICRPSNNELSHKFPRPDHTNTDATEHVTKLKSLENESGKDDTGRRWPRDEVLALINIRCSLFNNNGGDTMTHHDRENNAKGPLWERISQKMVELGYKRSAKRCKEKWENINKYFRKTKDLNKKRSIDSRTCPYYHQLNHLYNQGTLMGPSDQPMNNPGSPENGTITLSGQSQGNGLTTPANNGATTNKMHAPQGNEANVVQVPGFDFEF
ncbi:hypothetical protein SOVF_167040 [Spinacia oleracea]|uniref:Trihelix transcription factor GTL2 n=1 Tax=Spinacia oleracea TaxID=3562 RepID=A0A9R0IB75_SPIOL|nr:trihelix transcription factor GTL2 [Spinacia oleracea]KNA07962.1 hypothetical protein SOVF_167040 [Spinacia oleracea]